MSCIVSGNTTGMRPVTCCMSVSRSSATRRIQPSLTVAEIAIPRWLITRLPRVVSTLRIASISGRTSSSFRVAMSTGEFIIVTTGWAMVGAFGQTWVETSTSPGRRSRFCAMRPSLRAQATAVTAPSPSDTSPIFSGRAPMPPSRPMTPRVGAGPPASRPWVPGTVILRKSVLPSFPVNCLTSTSVTPTPRMAAATSCPVTVAESSRSSACSTAENDMRILLPGVRSHGSAPAARFSRGKTGMLRPPSITIARPVTKSNAGEHTSATIRPISASVTSRPSGVAAIAAAR